MSMTNEIWLPIPDYPDYDVSNLGRVRSRRSGTECILKPSKQKYHTVQLYSTDGKKYYSVHRLVLLAFVGERPDGSVIRHRDGNTSNNALTNLTYGTAHDNSKDRCLHGNSGQKLNNRKVRIIRALHKLGFTQKRLTEIFGVNKQTMSKIILKKTYRYV